MKNRKLEPPHVARWLQNLSDQEFIAFFREHLADRHIYRGERRTLDSHLVLANAVRAVGEESEPWRLQLLCSTPDQAWSADAPVCQFGTHCGHETASVARQSQCPVCGGEVSGS